MALCAEKLGDIARAIDLYKHYVNWPTKVPKRAEVVAKIEELEKRSPVEEQPSHESVVPQELEQPPEPENEEPFEPEETAEEGFEASETNIETRSLAVPGWIVVGTGAASIVAGAILLFAAHAKEDEMRKLESSDEPYDPVKHDELPDQGRALELAGWITGGVGAAIASIGVVLLIVDRKRGEQSKSYASYFLNGGRDGVRMRFVW